MAYFQYIFTKWRLNALLLLFYYYLSIKIMENIIDIEYHNNGTLYLWII